MPSTRHYHPLPCSLSTLLYQYQPFIASSTCPDADERTAADNGAPLDAQYPRTLNPSRCTDPNRVRARNNPKNTKRPGSRRRHNAHHISYRYSLKPYPEEPQPQTSNALNKRHGLTRNNTLCRIVVKSAADHPARGQHTQLDSSIAS